MVLDDKPLVEVERNPVGPGVATRFEDAVRHGKGGVFIAPAQANFVCPRLSEQAQTPAVSRVEAARAFKLNASRLGS